MTKRGRKSSASSSVVAVDAAKLRPRPPADLTKAQTKVWQSIVDSTPGGWFQEGDALLTMYCRHVASADHLAQLINTFEVDASSISKFGRLLAMRERETRMVSHLATKMRLTQQARMHPRSAGRAFDAQPRSKPWEC